MITEIGIVAGDIWQYLEKRGSSEFSAIVKAVKRDKEIVLMSLGWLAREGHVVIEKKDSGYTISFNKAK